MRARVDSLQLHVTGGSESSARELAAAISERLGERLAQLGVNGHVDRIRVEISARPGESAAAAAARAIAALGVDSHSRHRGGVGS